MDDMIYMKAALYEARTALKYGEIPIGAVIVKDGEIVGRGYNRRSVDGSPFGHAEMAAMTDAAEKLRSWRFDGCTIYVTLEPCAMCAGAMVQCRMGRIVYGARDPRAGAAGSLYNIPADLRICHKCKVTSNVMEKECAEILQNFFIEKRKDRVKQDRISPAASGRNF